MKPILTRFRGKQTANYAALYGLAGIAASRARLGFLVATAKCEIGAVRALITFEALNLFPTLRPRHHATA